MNEAAIIIRILSVHLNHFRLPRRRLRIALLQRFHDLLKNCLRYTAWHCVPNLQHKVSTCLAADIKGVEVTYLLPEHCHSPR